MSLLSKYSRIPGINVFLPSRGAFGPETLELDDAGTVRTFPMTANDELTFNTPDLYGDKTVDRQRQIRLHLLAYIGIMGAGCFVQRCGL